MAKNKKRYIDNDTRAELNNLKNTQFNSAEELELKLEEIQRKKSQRGVSRIVRIFGFVFLLIIFITACDACKEGSFFGIFDSDGTMDYRFSDFPQDHVRNAIESDNVGYYKNVVYKNTQLGSSEEPKTVTMSISEYKLMFGSSNNIYELVEPGVYEGGWFETSTHYQKTSTGKIERVTSTYYLDRSENNKNYLQSKYCSTGENFEVVLANSTTGYLSTVKVAGWFQDTFELGYGMITILFTIVLVCLFAAIVYLTIFITKDVIDVIKGTVGSAGNLADSATTAFKENLGIKKKETEDSDSKPRRSLFSEEELAAEAEAMRKSADDRRKDDTEIPKQEPERKPEAEKSETISPEDLDKLLSSN